MSNPISPDLLAKLQQLGWVSAPAGQAAPAPAAPAAPAPLPPTPGLTATRPRAPSIYLPPTAPPGPMGHATPRAPQPYQYRGPEIAESGPAAAPVFAQQQPSAAQQAGQSVGINYGGAVSVPARDISLIGPTERAEMTEARKGEREAIGRVGQAEVNANEGEANALDEIAQKQGEDAIVAQAAELPRQKAMQEQEAEYARLQKSGQDGQVQYDRRSFGARALGAVFMGLNAFGNALQKAPGAPNLAKEIIDESIDRDFREQLEAQKTKSEARKEKIAGSADLLERMRSRFKDERAAETGFRAMRWQEYAAQAQATAKRAQSPVLEARANMFQAQADVETAKADADTHKFMPGGTVGIAGDAELYKKYADAWLHGDQKIPLMNFGDWRGARGGGGASASPQAGAPGQQKAADQVREYDNALEKLRQMQAMIQQGGQFSRARTAQGQALAGAATNEIARAQTGGTRAPSEAEQALIRKQIPSDPNSLQFTGADLAKIQTTIKNMEAERARAAAAAGMGAAAPTPSAADLGATPLGGK